MLFNSLDFLLFFPAVCLIAYALRSLRARNLFLLAASYWFYMNWRAEYALLILWGTALTWVLANAFGRMADRPRLKKALLVAGLAGVLAPLFASRSRPHSDQRTPPALRHAWETAQNVCTRNGGSGIGFS